MLLKNLRNKHVLNMSRNTITHSTQLCTYSTYTNIFHTVVVAIYPQKFQPPKVPAIHLILIIMNSGTVKPVAH